MSNQICDTIFQQFGGGRSMAMIGGQAYADGDTLQVNWKCRGSLNKSNRVRITYNHGTDTYTVVFGNVRASRYTERSTHPGIYCDQLVELFERETGLRLSL